MKQGHKREREREERQICDRDMRYEGDGLRI